MRKLTVTCVIPTGGGMWKRAAVVVFRDRLAMSHNIDIEEYGEHQRIRHLRYIRTKKTGAEQGGGAKSDHRGVPQVASRNGFSDRGIVGRGSTFQRRTGTYVHT